jgi:response regulator RpfG family c-di-GMP phosphodiesterase
LKKQLNVLFIEDNRIEVMKMDRTISTLKMKHNITEGRTVDEAFKFLEGKEDLPDIILLDLNLPKVSGIEFLTILKSSDDLKHIPTVVLTTSDNQKNLEECYKIGISGYILKPLKYNHYVDKIEIILPYWGINELKRY